MSSLPAHTFDLHAFNTLGLPCQAHHFIALREEGQLPELSGLIKQNPSQQRIHQGLQPTQSGHCSQTVHILGGGSNVLLPPQLICPVVHVQLKGIELLQDNTGSHSASHYRIRVAAGENWHEWVTFALSQGWHGLENLALIPGSVGASPVQNIGAYGVEVGQFIESVQVWNLEHETMHVLTAQECAFGYRDSRFKRAHAASDIIVAVNFALPKVWQPVLNYPDLSPLAHQYAQDASSVTPQDVYDMVCEVRQRKLPDPNVIPNVGSFFQNPIVTDEQMRHLKKQFPHLVCYAQSDGRFKLAAGWLIDQCGWKGKRLGPVGMHSNQALVLINPDGGNLDDVMALAQSVQKDVFKRFEVQLQIEPICFEPNA